MHFFLPEEREGLHVTPLVPCCSQTPSGEKAKAAKMAKAAAMAAAMAATMAAAMATAMAAAMAAGHGECEVPRHDSLWEREQTKPLSSVARV